MELLTLPGKRAKGKVYLLGAGPGDPELLTVKAWHLLQRADVVLFDALVSPEILALIPEGAERIAVGKRAGEHSASQSEINRLLLTKAFTRQTVVRLKGGDPFIFGRGGEELQTLAQAGVAFEVVPGITAASGTAAYAGIPLTHRDFAQGVSFITGHCQLQNRPMDWQGYANPANTLVVYMGILNAGLIQQQLIAHGRSPQTPVAIVSKATTRQQQRVIGTLEQLQTLAQDPRVVMPALMIIGEVVALADSLSWFEPEAANNDLQLQHDAATAL
ncbi:MULTISPECIES: uroporphyrinogen-III C-methyltransferase [Shewanella]|jgi:uroporphyrin-III C-methyltransferase|uniref:uroporphyrinogen-III C-methyltransferase n=1 Tax=Shewanella algae TaxID=38313 RepID=A0A7T8INS6_9GAMM|nr:uroporphyrinogen-III C-methyltransferase [Shewanella algae]MBO2551262.1 uroporphyrinogen-III C-methyltransferase [Shewanella algae]MBO2585507.1 uroporphyrinogen-III C-methyltransferase [Shewanella algae]MBO2594016.1 uroporphyrinogen-III C-methyltransferase [Shewanella algae]MBO2602347.1 uroporphyrinogen-III C-methyltransferase [Shewanella algae]MBO2640202.1 uroporphyrinogen-III C-methyltransferase [Shewanella algae]